MSQIIDRRRNGRHKSAVNRQRFLNRFKKQIKEAVSNAINKRSITDIESGETVTIPAKDIKEPIFRYGRSGRRELIFTGNKEFVKGDHIPKPQVGDQGFGSQASDTGEGMDDFVFNISRDEFLELYFEDLALPDLVKKQISQLPVYKMVRAGYTTAGVPTNINIIRSMRGAYGRRIALGSPYKKRLKVCEEELANIETALTSDDKRVIELKEEIQYLRKKIKSIPFIDTFDLRYNNRIKQLIPTTQAVMFCIMDVSGSMDRAKKDIAKRFFILLYLFLRHNYEKIDVVFIRHHTSAKEVNEEEFFYSRETGGTVASSSLQLLKKIINERYAPEVWNIYAAQASDGDNWNADSPRCYELLNNDIMPKTQYFAYVEIMPRLHQSLWDVYLNVKEQHANFAMQTIHDLKDIYPVFRELFKRRTV